MSKPSRKGTAILKAGIDLSSDGKAPTEIRLLKQGENRTDRLDTPVFTFDEVAAAMVMQAWREDGSPRLYADWNHGMLAENPTREQAASSCSFVPEVRDGDFMATDIQWTEPGREDVEGRLYNLFSPAFSWECGADGALRPDRLINFALVNLAGLKDIEPLLAASAALTQQQENNAMEYEKLYNEAKARNVELEAELKVARGASTEAVALIGAVGLAATVPHAERVATLSSLVTLRGEVFKITGQTTPEGAVSALLALKTQADKTVALEAERDAEKLTALTAELDGVLKTAVDEFKLEPAKKDELRASLVKLAGGKITREVVDAAKVHVGMLTAKVTGEGKGKGQPATGDVDLTATDKHYAKLAGVTEEQALKSKKQIQERAAR